ncbi:hypothetical protein ACHAPT_012426 [Fusarium lateritium]
MKQYGYYCHNERLTVTSSFSYEIPSGAIIRTIKDSQEPPVTAKDAKTTDEADDTEDDTSTDDDTTTEDEPTDTDTETATETDDEPTTTATEDDDASSSATFITDPTTSGSSVAAETELSESKNKLRSAVAAASALGAILGTLIILAIAFIWYRKRAQRRQQQQQQQEQPSQPTSHNPMMHSQPSSVPGYSHQYYETVSNPPSASVSPPNTSFGGSATAPSPTSRADEQMPHIPELGRYRY